MPPVTYRRIQRITLTLALSQTLTLFERLAKNFNRRRPLRCGFSHFWWPYADQKDGYDLRYKRWNITETRDYLLVFSL